MNENKKLISIVIPVYNEEDNIEHLYKTLQPIVDDELNKYRFEFIFTDNHSTDTTYQKLLKLNSVDKRIRVFRFSKNFGYQKSILTGYIKSRGEAIIQLDCDLQDPPSLMGKFLEYWEDGYAVVYGIRKSRQESKLIQWTRHFFYKITNYLSDDELPVDAGDFRLVDRRVVRILEDLNDSTPYLRGAIASMGFNQKGIEYDRGARERGNSNFRIKDLVGLALDGILNHSVVPLRISTYCGFVITIFLLIGTLFFIVRKLFFDVNWPQGFTTITVLVLLGICMNAIFLGIIGEYIGRIYKQSKFRYSVIIEKQVDEYDV